MTVSSKVAKRKKRIELREDSDIYLKRSNNEEQDKYMRLASANFVESLECRWRLLKPSDKAPEGQFRFLCFFTSPT
ncbi:hypothetical protein PHMEG_0001465 [Phytophthora megakarya]|uniref:Uncharacterized protein n=1 Tax=Phytophthora megakarya TaxID=4795 RepID=A0A225X1K8_9STRA|nr:hypothetical protein PHMEG_0001465 [Phytophthora megakarya]